MMPKRRVWRIGPRSAWSGVACARNQRSMVNRTMLRKTASSRTRTPRPPDSSIHQGQRIVWDTPATTDAGSGAPTESARR